MASFNPFQKRETNRPTPKRSVIIHTDGACNPNPGVGGWAARIAHTDSTVEYLCGGFQRTTNNRMELYGAIAALSHLEQPHKIIIYTDSQYFCGAVESRRIYDWQRANWVRGQKCHPIPNSDLWQILIPLLTCHAVAVCWVKGHSGILENEEVDALAEKQTCLRTHPIDYGYINRPQ